MTPKRKNYLSRFEAWAMLMSGETIAAIRLTDAGWNYLRRHAMHLGRKLVGSGDGVYRSYSLT